MFVDIIGAGIGGLTTAIALEQKGIKTRVFEQTTTIKPVGAGIILANNAMQVYDKLGLRKVIEENGNIISSLNIIKPNLKPLSKVSLSYFEEQFKVKSIAIHRGILQQILIDQLGPSCLHLNHKLKTINKSTKGNTLEFENGKKIESTIIIAADGINSIIRQQVFSNTFIRSAKQICWRGVVNYNLPKKHQHELNEAWGKDERFGFVQIAKNKVYWFALKSFENNKKEYTINNLDNYFTKHNPLIKSIISSTNKEQIHTSTIIDLKPINKWFKKNICLIGDAAHAMTPNMGQGACQAIEDAYILSECLHKYETEKAFTTFQKLRIAKVHQIVESSWKIGKIAHLSNPFLIGVRNQMIKIIPSSINKKQLQQIFKIPTV